MQPADQKHFYSHLDARAMTNAVVAWANDPAGAPVPRVVFSTNCNLTAEATAALVRAPRRAAAITTLEFRDIYFAPEQLAELLTLPALVHLSLYGGTSSDGLGLESVFPTLAPEHLTVLEKSPDARRLRALVIDKQNLGEAAGNALRRALPNLETLTIERRSY